MINTVQQKLQLLRERWKNEPENRRTIELQAKVLKLTEVRFREPAAIPDDPFVLQVAEALL